jgi:HSP20 family protein
METKDMPASSKTNGSVTPVTEVEGNKAVRHEERAPWAGLASSFNSMRRFAEDMDRMLENWGFNRSMGQPLFRFRPVFQEFGENGLQNFIPQIDQFVKDGNFIVKVDLPGMKKEDVKVEFGNGELIIRGERKDEKKEEREGYFRSERSYGSFYRSIQLPEGVKPEDTKATYTDGVLEVSINAPKLAEGRKQIEIA